MRIRFFNSIGAATLATLFVLPAQMPLAGQARSAAGANSAAKVWNVPRTPDGQPDLQGIWTNATVTPLERPTELAGKQVFTEGEAAEYEKQAVQRNNADRNRQDLTPQADVARAYNDLWYDRGTKVVSTNQTSLIVDPPDGRIPALTPEAVQRQAAAAAADRAKGVDVTSTGLYTRCITGNGGPPRVPGGVTAESEIVQTPGYVVIVIQANNDARIIPLNGSPHLPQSVGLWLGDARGHWEGNTLVVETTNFHKDRNWRGSRDGMKLVERFTLVGPKTLRYEFTVSDPTTWTKPWSIDSLLPKIDAPIYEFACHEQNYGLINWAIGSQIREAEAGRR